MVFCSQLSLWAVKYQAGRQSKHRSHVIHVDSSTPPLVERTSIDAWQTGFEDITMKAVISAVLSWFSDMHFVCYKVANICIKK